MPRFESRLATVCKIIQESPRVKRLFFSLDKPLIFQPGQAIALSIPKVVDSRGVLVKRMFSMASLPGSELELCVAIKGPPSFTANIAELKVGDTAVADGPFGQFVLKRPIPDGGVTFISAGTGIAPMICMLRVLQEENYTGRIDFVFGFRTPDDFLYKNELASMTHESGGKLDFHLTTVISGEGFPEWQGKKGRLPPLLPKLLQNNGQDVYICGPPAMVQDTVASLLAIGFAPQKIKREQW